MWLQRTWRRRRGKERASKACIRSCLGLGIKRQCLTVRKEGGEGFDWGEGEHFWLWIRSKTWRFLSLSSCLRRRAQRSVMGLFFFSFLFWEMLCLDWEKGREKKRKKVGNLSKHFVIRFLFGEGFKWLVKKDDVAGFYWLAYNQFFFMPQPTRIYSLNKIYLGIVLMVRVFFFFLTKG